MACEVVGGTRLDAGYTFTTLDHPLAGPTYFGTEIVGISGDAVAGTYYTDGAGSHGFTWHNGVYSSFDYPGTNGYTYVTGLRGNIVTGYYHKDGKYHGFSLSLSDPITPLFYSTIDHPLGTLGTYVDSFNNTQFTGSYQDATGEHGFVYKNGTFTDLDFPLTGSTFTRVRGTNGITNVGEYDEVGRGSQGFSETDGVFTTLKHPLADYTHAYGISDANEIVGYYVSYTNGTHGFVETEGVYTTLSHPLATLGTRAYGMYGTTIVGSYGVVGGSHGFIATLDPVPEPGSLGLLGCGAIGLLLRQRARWRWR